MAQWTNPRIEQRRHSKELGETAVAIAVLAAAVPTIDLVQLKLMELL